MDKFPQLAQPYIKKRPQWFTPDALFEHCVKMAAQNGLDLTPKQHEKWALYFFPFENTVNRDSKMSRVHTDFGIKQRSYFLQLFHAFTLR